MDNILKKIKKRFSKKELLPLGLTALISVALVSFLHLMGTFDFLELKMYDFKFGVRDNLYSTDREDLDVSIVYSDDESYALLSKEFSYPYPRGKVWAKAIENLSDLGAKVIVLDYMFDANDLSTTHSRNTRDDLLEGKYNSLDEKAYLEKQFIIDDNDQLLYNVITQVEDSVAVLLSGKTYQDPNSTRLYQILTPSTTIGNIPLPLPGHCSEGYCSNSNFLNKLSCVKAGHIWSDYKTPLECEEAGHEWIEEPYKGVPFGLIDIAQDSDGFLRKYIAFQKLPDSKYFNYSLAIVAALKFYNEDYVDLKPIYNESEKTIKIGNNIIIDTYGAESSFLLNYYGPSSAAEGISGTFKNYPLWHILDDNETCFGDCLQGEIIIDLNGNGKCDNCEFAPDKLYDTNWNLELDDAEIFFDCNHDKTICDGDENWKPSKGNGIYDEGEDFIDANGNKKWDAAEKYDDNNQNGVYDPIDLFIPDEDDENDNGVWDDAEEYTDANKNNIYDDGEEFVDANDNGEWDDAEYYEDLNNNGVYDPVESFIDYNCNGKWDFDILVPSPDNKIDDDWLDLYTNPCNQYYHKFGPEKSPFKDKIVILGTSLPEEHDVQSVPLMETEAGSFLMPGVDIHANAIQQILDNSYIKSSYNELEINSQNWIKHIGLIIILVIITLVIVSPFDTFGSTISMVLLLFLWFSFSVSQFAGGFWIFKYIIGSEKAISSALDISNIVPTIFPMISILIPYGLNLSYKLYTENKNKKFLKSTFGNYISSELVDQMYESQEIPELGGKEGYHTLIFSDVASFSSFSEAMTAPQLVELLNEYLTAMTQIILDNGGTVDKYIGDAIVAFYGAPVDVEDHENKAMLTVVQMNEKLDELRDKWRSEGDKWPDLVKNMQHRVGINTGYLVTGNMGSELQMNYTCMGDTVNLAARLESGSKQWGIDAQVAQSVYDKTKDNFVFRKLGGIRVKGKTEPVNVYELLCELGKEPKGLDKLLKQFDTAMELYLKQDWDNAIKAFEDSDKLEDMSGPRKTNPSKTYIKICNEFKENPPGDDWDGVYTFKTK